MNDKKKLETRQEYQPDVSKAADLQRESDEEGDVRRRKLEPTEALAIIYVEKSSGWRLHND